MRLTVVTIMHFLQMLRPLKLDLRRDWLRVDGPGLGPNQRLYTYCNRDPPTRGDGLGKKKQIDKDGTLSASE